MPVYTLRDTKENIEWDVNMSYADLQRTLDENANFKHIIKPIKIAANAGKGNLARAGDGWKDVLKEMKTKSGRRNNINV